MKIIVVILGRIGDMILSTPLFSIIKKQLPDSEITVLASVPNHIVIKNNPNIDKILIFDKSPLKLAVLYSKLRKINFDYLIDPKDHYSRESKLIATVVHAKHKIGFIGDKKKSPFTRGIADSLKNENVHYISRVLNVLTCLSIQTPEQIPLPELFTPAESDIKINKFFENVNDKKILLINLSAGSPDRLWPAEKWTSVINSVDKRKVFSVLIYMNSEKILAEEIMNATNIVSFNSDNFDDIITIISKCDILISPDTSLIHVASAFNKPILALYNGLQHNYKKFAPLSSQIEIVFAADGQKSIEEIDTRIVIVKLSELLNRI